MKLLRIVLIVCLISLPAMANANNINLFVLDVKDKPMTLPAKTFESYLPEFLKEQSKGKNPSGQINKIDPKKWTGLGKVYKFHVKADDKAAQKGHVKLINSKIPVIFLPKSGATNLIGFPDTELIVPMGAAVGRLKVQKGKFVSTMKLQKDGHIMPDFSKSEPGTVIIDLAKNKHYQINTAGQFKPID